MNLKGVILFLSFAMISTTAWGIPLNEKKLKSEDQIETVEINATTSQAVTKADVRAMKKMERKEQRMNKRLAWLNKKLVKKYGEDAAIDFDDPVKKWMWFWIFGWAGGLLLWILSWTVLTSGGIGSFGVLGLLGSLAWLFGTVCLVIWLVKMNT